MTENTSPAASPKERPSFLRRLLRILGRTLAVLLVLIILTVLGFGLWAWSQLRGSLPDLDGEVRVQGIEGDITIERDSQGIPSIRGESRRDVAFGLGFLHAQERFFQMDLLRRRAAGELAEVFGAGVVPSDAAVRIHRFRHLAQRVLAESDEAERAVLEGYAAGVNAGLDALDAPAFEYLVFRTEPSAWQEEDSILVLLSMFLQLQGGAVSGEAVVSGLHEALPQELFDFLLPRGDEWDAPLLGESRTSPQPPSPEVLNLRTANQQAARRPASEFTPPFMPGSNAFAVSGDLAEDGGALVAEDLHLAFSVPNLWYRAVLEWPDDTGQTHRVVGVTLPGSPATVVGSNTHVAWGVSNSVVDTSDLVVLEIDPEDPEVYMTPDGPRRIEYHREVIRSKGGGEEEVEVAWTIWGPVIEDKIDPRKRAVRWVVHEDGAVDFNILRLETAGDLDQALDLAASAGAPALNIVFADAEGRIGWTILGRLPQREGTEGWLQSSSTDATKYWDGLLPPEETPRISNPPSDRLWTANNRLVDGEMLALLGRAGSGYLPGARARQIRDALFDLEEAEATDLLNILLDNRALSLARWRDKLLEVLDDEVVAADPQRAEMRRLVEAWDGRASLDAVGYRMVRTFRIALARRLLDPLVAPYLEVVPQFEFVIDIMQFETPLWQLVSEEPMHLLDPQYSNYQAAYLAAVGDTFDTLLEEGGEPLDLSARTWGEKTVTDIRHPLSRALPFLSGWLDMPARSLPGDMDMPRIHHPRHGSTLRMVVSPGREEEGILHMPGGQSGHPLSPNYRDGFDSWAAGEASPLLPGSTVHTLRLVTEGS